VNELRDREIIIDTTWHSIWSLLLPGLGDLYLGHRLLGILEIMGSVLVWGIVILNFLEGKYAILTLLVLVNGTDAFLTYHMAKKGYMLARTV